MVVKVISRVQNVQFNNELERNTTIKLGYANTKIYKGEKTKATIFEGGDESNATDDETHPNNLDQKTIRSPPLPSSFSPTDNGTSLKIPYLLYGVIDTALSQLIQSAIVCSPPRVDQYSMTLHSGCPNYSDRIGNEISHEETGYHRIIICRFSLDSL